MCISTLQRMITRKQKAYVVILMEEETTTSRRKTVMSTVGATMEIALQILGGISVKSGN